MTFGVSMERFCEFTTQMKSNSTILQDIFESRAIGAARLGSPIRVLSDRYGEPTSVVDHVDAGLTDQRIKIWNFGVLQAWSDNSGLIERLFLNAHTDYRRCTNENFQREIEPIAEALLECNFEDFQRLATRDEIKYLWKRSGFIEAQIETRYLEMYGTFVAEELSSALRLRMFRINVA